MILDKAPFMSLYDPARYDYAVCDILSKIETSVAFLCQLIDESSPTTAFCYNYPELTLDEEKANKLAGKSVSRSIEVTLNADLLSATTSIKKAFKDFYSHEKTSSKSTFRLPGMLVIEDVSYFNSITEAVNEVNELKSQFQQLIAIPDEDISPSFSKDEYFIDKHKYLVKLQVSRQIKCYHFQANYSVGFHWADKPLSSVVTVSGLTTKITSQIERLNQGLLLGSRHESKVIALELFLERLKALPVDVELRERRPIQTQPSVNIRLLKTKGISPDELKALRNDEAFKANFTVPIPFIVLSTKTMKISSHLENYMPKESNLTANGKYCCIDSRLNIYQKLV